MLLRFVLVAAAAVTVSAFDLTATTQTPEAANCSAAVQCVPNQCELPDCFCSGQEPTVFPESSRPQIIYLTYDDAFTAYAEEHFYRGIFNGTYKNPDGNPIRATHFLSAQYTDFTLVNQYYKMGHEMASHSITHRSNIDYWKGLNVDGWSDEALGMRKMITQFAAIPAEEIKGFRAPFLQMGGDEMFTALERDGFGYDCSWVSRNYGYLDLDKGLFPYSLDYATVQDCEIKPCPSCEYNKLWVQPMLDLEDLWLGADPFHPNNGMPCSMLDGCIIIKDNPTREDVKGMLMQNFLRNRNGTRAPMGFYMHAAWFFGDTLIFHYDGYKDFIQEVTETYDDVWFVTVNEGLNYVKNFNNYSNADILALDQNPNITSPFAFNPPAGPSCDAVRPCQFPHVNNTDINNQERYMPICGRKADGSRQSCPPMDRYPWLGDPCGGNTPCV